LAHAWPKPRLATIISPVAAMHGQNPDWRPSSLLSAAVAVAAHFSDRGELIIWVFGVSFEGVLVIKTEKKKEKRRKGEVLW